jgi:hypothetical protein
VRNAVTKDESGAGECEEADDFEGAEVVDAVDIANEMGMHVDAARRPLW